MTLWNQLQDWLDSEDAILASLVFVIAIFGFTGTAGILPWAPIIYGAGMMFLLWSIDQQRKINKRKYDLTKAR